MSLCHDRAVRTAPALTLTSLLAIGLLAGCGSSDPESAKDLAKAAGCSDIQKAEVGDRADYEESVTCTVNDVKVQVYWAPDGSDARCLSDSTRCKAAVDKFRRH